MSKRLSGLEIEQSTSGERHTLALGGELDIDSVPVLHAAVARICDAGSARGLTLDLRGLTFIDSTGLAEIILTSRLCDRDAIELTLTPGSRAVQRLFELTGLSDALPFSSTGEARQQPSRSGQGAD
jgi:anti-sigma B factor antagonist